jgi:hypothetical protein
MSGSKRRLKREASERRRLAREQSHHDDIVRRVLAQFPSFPPEEMDEFVKRARWPGAVLRWERNRDEVTVRRAVEAYARHRHTDYDQRLKTSIFRNCMTRPRLIKAQVRAEIKPTITRLLDQWAIQS